MAALQDTIILARDNYQSWSRFIKCVLQTEGLFMWLNKSDWPDLAELKALEIFKLSQSKQRAAGIIKTYVSHEIELTIGHLDDPSEIWETLKLNLEVQGRALKSYNVNEFRNLHINPEEDIPTYIARFEEAYRRVVDAGEDIAEKHRCYQLIESLPEDYDYLIRELDRLPEEDFKFSHVKEEILKEYSRRELRERQRNETLLVSSTTSSKANERSFNTHNFKPNSSLSNSFSEPNVKCWACGKFGHQTKNCRTRNKKNQEVKQNSYVTEFADNDCYSNEILPPCWEWTLDSASTSHVCQNRQFFTFLKEPPQGAAVRMGTTPHTVRGIGKVSFKIKDKGKISTVNLHNVLYVPDIHRNLISMSKMDKAGLHAKMNKGFQIFSPSWKYLYAAVLKNNFYVLKAIRELSSNYKVKVEPRNVIDSSKAISSGMVKNSQLKSSSQEKFSTQTKPLKLSFNTELEQDYSSKLSSNVKTSNRQLPKALKSTNLQSVTANRMFANTQRGESLQKINDLTVEVKAKRSNNQYNAAYAIERNNIMLWHERLGHSNLNVIKRMFRENLIRNCGQLQGKETQCEPCVLAKNTRATHPKLSKIRSKEILELVHSDVWGPAPVTSRNGHRYVLTFIDDYSRRAFCYPLKSKDEVSSKLKNFIAFAERQTSKKVKVIRTDNGLEYCNKQIEDMLRKAGIKHERTSVYSPQMNGVSERYNRVLFEGMRTFTQAANLPAKLWVETIMAVNYIRNRILHTGIDAIPFQRWYGVKPSIHHLKRYGCIAYVHQPKERRNKFEPRAKRGIFVGYGLGSSGYRVYFPRENTIVESKHVTFDEAQLGRPAEQKITHRAFVDFSSDDSPVFTGIMQQELDDESVEQTSTSSTPTDAEREKQPATDFKKDTKDESETSEDDDSTDVPSEEEEQVSKAKFHRFLKKRKKGQTAGKTDIYLLAPCGTRLRSNREFKVYCKEHKIIYKEDVADFSVANNYQGPIYLEKYTESEPRIDEALLTEIVIPRSPRQAKELAESQKWKEAMDQEIQTMLDRKVWTPVPKKENLKIIGTKWVYTIKQDAEGKISTFKARLVALGNNQRDGLDYNETYSPVVNFTLIRLFVAFLVSILNWAHCLLDVKCAYLYGNIDKEIYIRQPEDYVIPGKESYVLKLKKAIYGLHQAGRCWYNDLHSKLIENGFNEVPGLTCVYSYKNEAIILVYVDDLPIFAKNYEVLKEVVNLIKSIYEVKNLGPITMLLGINFKMQNNDIININCEHYIEKCLKKFEIDNFSNVSLPSSPGYNPVPPDEEDFPEHLPFRNLLGCLQYIAHRCRPDVAWTVAALSQFTEKHDLSHHKALLRTLMYLASTKSLGLKLTHANTPIQLALYVDASWASDTTDRKSWSGYAAFLNGIPVTWRVTKQTCVALSPMEAEFISATEAVKELKFLHACLTEILKVLELDESLIQRPILFCDNTAAIAFTKNKADNVRNRYVDLKYKFIRDWYEQGLFDIRHVPSKENYADLLTKSLNKDSFIKFRGAFLC